MNDEIPPVYTVSKGSQRTRLTEVDLQFLQVITDLIVYFSEDKPVINEITCRKGSMYLRALYSCKFFEEFLKPFGYLIFLYDAILWPPLR